MSICYFDILAGGGGYVEASWLAGFDRLGEGGRGS